MDFDIMGDGGDRVMPHKAWTEETQTPATGLNNILHGPMRGALRAESALFRTAAGFLPESAWNPTYTDPVKGWLYDQADIIDKEILPPLTPTPGSIGLASQILGGAAELPGGLIFGGPAGLAVTSAVSTGTSLVDSGVDAGAATVAGIGTGIAVAAMMAIPGAGETLKGTAALMSANPLIGMGQRYATQQGLEAAGYPEQAQQFDPFDPAALGTDLAFSLVFGGLGYRAGKYTREAQTKVAKLAEHWQEIQDTLPVEVVDSAHVMGTWFKALESNPHNDAVRGAVEVHLAALDKALADLQAGKPVDIGREVKSLFGPDYATPTAEAFRGMLREVWKLDEEQTDVTLSMVNAFARYKGEHLDDYINRTFAGGEAREPIGRAVLEQAAWHGSPHAFTRFSSAHIGSGEGAQGFGWGLYFAESRDVAEYYRDMFSDAQKYEKKYYIRDIKIPENLIEDIKHAIVNNKSYNNSKKIVKKHISDVSSEIPEAYYNIIEIEDVMNKLSDKDILDIANKKYNIEYHQTINKKLYKVELAPKESDYLLWDKPLSEQSDKVREIISNIDKQYPDNDHTALHLTGKDYYNGIVSQHRSDRTASEYLHSLGIRGIKYLDAPGRSMDEGTYNYVIFNDADVEITALYQTPQALQLRNQLEQMPPLVIDPVRFGDPSNKEAVRKEAWSYYMNELRKETATNIYDQQEFKFSRDGINELKQHSADIRIMQLVSGLKTLLTEGIPLTSRPPDGNERNIKAYHHYGAKAELNGEELFVRLVVREDNNGNFFYDIPEIIETKRADASKQGETALPGSNPAQRPSSKERILNDLLSVNESLYQEAKGAISFLTDGRAVLHALKNPDISTVMHELAHVWRRQLDPEDLAVVAEFYADPGNKWSRSAEEKFAQAWEKYLSDGKAPSEKLQGVFEKFKTWLADIYRGIIGSPLEMQIPNRVRDVFDKMLTRERTPEETAYREAAAEVLAEETTKGGEEPWARRNPEAAARSVDVTADPAGASHEPPLPPDRPPNDWFPDETGTGDQVPGTAKTKNSRGAAETIEQAIIRLGGVNRDQADSQWGATLTEGQRARMYKRKGLTIERMTEALAEEGFLPVDEHGKPVVGALENALARSMAGEDIIASSATDRQLDSRAAAAEASYRRRHGPDAPLTDTDYEALQARMIAEDAADPLSRQVNIILKEQGDFELYTETTSNNETRSVTAREALKRAQQEVETARKSRDVYEAAAACLYL